MVPCSFDQSNCVLGRPEGMEDEECAPLCVMRYKTQAGPVVLSCWKLTIDEVAELNRTGRIWLYVYGETMPPVALEASNPFVTP
jgi:hypothetical protein